MDTIFVNSENSKTSDPHKLLLNLSDKIDLQRSDTLLYQILAYTIHGKMQKSTINTINLKYLGQRGIKNLNYLKDHILYQIFKIILSISSKK